ncbi:MAG: mobile mystery protein A [Gemmatimonadetes bacterium]|jgi:predicted DNA-binding mobile mystery protein A|nr:mobile mystery protein A [Gemmatimonadota bacterium]MBT6148098.1 mobile mystery protein A [Gemmatimonadota bacterium]MBT7864214.1 mobile mystery protein A [Gemmatimonadota bacterium]
MKRKPAPRVARQITRQLDDTLAKVHLQPRPRTGWIATIRQALGMNQTQLAKRLGVARPSVAQLESNEARDAVSLASLRRAAAALGCDLHYTLVPRQPLKDMIADQARSRAQQKLGRVNESQALEASAIAGETLAATVMDLAEELQFQRPTDLWND